MPHRFSSAQLLLNILLCFYSVRDYITSGPDKKRVIDPDGRIHYRRLRSEKVNKNLNGYAVEANYCIQWPQDTCSWLLHLVDLPQLEHCNIFSYLPGGSKEDEQRRGVFKCKREGHALFKVNHEQDVKYNFS